VQWVDDTYFIASITGFSFLEYEFVGPYEDGSYEAVPYVVDEPFADVQKYHSSDPHPIGSYNIVPYYVGESHTSDFTYKPGPGLIEISTDGYQLIVNNSPRFIETQLSEPVVEAVWLPSAFYYEND
jgi:hypothetical protein